TACSKAKFATRLGHALDVSAEVHRTIFLIVSNGSPLALIASSLRSTSKKPVCPMTRSLDPLMAHCGQRVRFVATWLEEFFEVPCCFSYHCSWTIVTVRSWRPSMISCLRGSPG